MKSKTVNRIKDMTKPYLKSIIIVSLLSLVVSIGEIIKPYIIEIAIDDYLSKGIYKQGAITIGILGAIYIGIVLFGNIINFIATTAINIVGENVVYDLRNKLYRFTQYANIPFHDKTPAGKLFVAITNDVEDISTLFKDVASTIIKDIILIFAIVAVMIYFSYKLSLMAFIIVPFIIISSLVLTKMLRKIYNESKAIRANLNSFLAESIYGAKIIKIFNIQKEKKEECEGYTRKFRDSRTKTRIYRSFTSCNNDNFRKCWNCNYYVGMCLSYTWCKYGSWIYIHIYYIHKTVI